jgi:transcriptional regulator with XRE-family HTH domain
MPPQNTALEGNPIRVVRRSLGKTQQEFANLVGIDVTALYLAESGCYPRILPSLLKWFEKKGYNLEELRSDYRGFVKSTRSRFSSRYSPFDLPIPTFKKSPFTEWRETLNLSKTGFAKELCIQPSLLSRVESGAAHYLPEELEQALKDVGFEKDLLQELKDRVEEYFFPCSD